MDLRWKWTETTDCAYEMKIISSFTWMDVLSCKLLLWQFSGIPAMSSSSLFQERKHFKLLKVMYI